MPTKKKEDDTAVDTGPWWVENAAGDRFVWAVKADIDGKELKVVEDESPYDRNGGYRSPEPKSPVNPNPEFVPAEGDLA